MREKESGGVRRVVWIPLELDAIIEETRKRLGLNRSSFYRTAILRYLELTTALKTPEKNA